MSGVDLVSVEIYCFWYPIEKYPYRQKRYFVSHVYATLSRMKRGRCHQVREKQWLGGCAMFGLKEVTVLRHSRLYWNSNSMRKYWDYGRLEWKKTFGLINLEPSRLVVVLPEENLEKHGIK